MNGYQPIEALIEKSTDKALLIEVTTMRGQRKVWFPKSQTVVEGSIVWVKDWVLDSKEKEGHLIITVCAGAVEYNRKQIAA